MSTYNAKNYTAQGGSVTVIGGELQILGKLVIDPGAEIIGMPAPMVAEEVTLEGLPPAQSMPNSTASTVALLRADFNLLLANLREVGVLATGDQAADAP